MVKLVICANLSKRPAGNSENFSLRLPVRNFRNCLVIKENQQRLCEAGLILRGWVGCVRLGSSAEAV
jgi:hypothetical protein